MFSAGPAIMVGMFVVGFITGLSPSSEEPPWVSGLLNIALYIAVRGLVSATPFGAWLKFFRRALFIEWRTQEIPPAEVNQTFVACMNEAGRGARRLFRYIQGGRWTWTSPPVVADRALMLTYPIINVDLYSAPQKLSTEDFLVAYPRFFRDVAVLVAIGREDLIPDLRGKYSLIPAVSVSLPSEVPERDARFLDPMRDHSRWQVFKDYLLPLASWFSLALAIVVLVVNRLG
jgi:hypothetical protein